MSPKLKYIINLGEGELGGKNIEKTQKPHL